MQKLNFWKNFIDETNKRINNIFCWKEKKPFDLDTFLRWDKNKNAFLRALENELITWDDFLDLFNSKPNKEYDTHNTDCIIIKMVELWQNRPEFLEIKDELLKWDCDLDNLDCFKKNEIFQDFNDELKKITLILQDDVFANQIYFKKNNFDDWDNEIYYNKQSYINDVNDLIDFILTNLCDEQLNIFNNDIDYQLTNYYNDLTIKVDICIPKFGVYRDYTLDFKDFDIRDIIIMLDDIVFELKKEW